MTNKIKVIVDCLESWKQDYPEHWYEDSEIALLHAKELRELITDNLNSLELLEQVISQAKRIEELTRLVSALYLDLYFLNGRSST